MTELLKVTDADDIREDLELAVMELQDRFGVSPSSIRRFVNGALKATEDADGVRASAWLRKQWRRGS